MAFVLSRARHRHCTGAGTGLAAVHLRARIAVIAGRAVRLGRIVTHARRRIARAHVVACIHRCAGDGHCARARTGLARIALRTSVAVVAHRAVHLDGIVTHARRRVARARIVTLIRRRTHHGVCPGTRTRLARIALRTSVVVVARRTVHLGRIVAHARHGITRARVVTLIGRRARDRVCPGTRPILTTIRLRAGIAVVANGIVGFGGIVTHAGHRIARARVVTLIGRRARDRVCPGTRPILTTIRLRAGIAVVASGIVRFGRIVARARHRVARARVVALIGRHAHDRGCSGARPILTTIRLRTGIAVVANGIVGFGGVGTHARHRVAYARIVTLIGSATNNRIRPRTDAPLTRIGCRTGIAVVANAVVGFERIVADARRGVARARHMALIGSCTHDRACPRARPILTTIRLRAGIVVVTSGVVGFGGVGTRARHRVARADHVALIGSCTHDWVCPRAYPILTTIRLRAGIAVAASGVIGFGGVGTYASDRLTCACVMARIRCRTR